jgi:phosphomannomutase
VTQRILSISGLRGVIGDGLDPSYVVRFAAALGTMADGGTVVVSQDGRPSGEMIKQAVLAGLTAVGCRVVDAGIASTPTCGVLINHLNAQAGLQITASHNPIQWNGLKPFSSEGSILDAAAGQQLIDILEADSIIWMESDHLGSIERYEDPSTPHMEKVLNRIDVSAIQTRQLKVVLDCNHGSGGVLGPRFLKELGCEVHVLGGIPDGQFEHTPEPLKENLSELCEAVRRHGADVGFAQDPDADRLAIVDNTGRYIGEELTLALCVDHVLSQRHKSGASNCDVVVNGSTSRVIADIAENYGCQFHRSYVGEAHVVAKMKEVSAIIGGEGNGGVIEPEVGYVRDSFVGMAYVLEGLASENRSLADWADAMPQYTIVKDKITCPRDQVAVACNALKAAYPDAAAQEGDGLRLEWDDRWVQVRASNTEPIIRVIAEAPEEKVAKDLCNDAMEIVREKVESRR